MPKGTNKSKSSHILTYKPLKSFENQRMFAAFASTSSTLSKCDYKKMRIQKHDPGLYVDLRKLCVFADRLQPNVACKVANQISFGVVSKRAG